MSAITYIRNLAGTALRIKPSDNVPPEVAEPFPHNVLVNTLDLSAFYFADSFVSINTIMPVFAATLTKNPIIIGLIPAIVNAGWFFPQLFMAGYVQSLKKKLPFALRLALLERIPFLLMPIFAFLLPQMAKQQAVTLLLLLMILRGLGSGLVALSWQELIATVIPITHRSRFFGFSRVVGQTMGIIGSAIAGLVLSSFPYPTNYGLGFSITVVAQWISFYFFSQNREPKPAPTLPEAPALPLEPGVTAPEAPSAPAAKPKMIDFNLFGRILRTDHNLQRYLVARSLLFFGNMATAFLAVYGLQKFSLDDGAAALFTGLIFLSGIVGYAVFGVLGDRIGPKKILMIAQVIWLFGMVVALSAASIGVYYLVFVAFGLNSAGMILGDSILVMELGDEQHRATYLGLTRSLTGVFVLLAPFVAGWLVEGFGYPLMFALSIVFTILGTSLFGWVKDRPRHRELVEEALA